MANTFTFGHLRGSQICLNYRENGERVNVKGLWGEREEGLVKKSRKYLQGEAPRRGAMEGGNNRKSEQLLHTQQRKKRRGEKWGE